RDLALIDGWTQCRRAELTRCLGDLARVDVEEHVASVSKQSKKTAAKTVRRAKTLAAHPAFADALGAGQLSTDHVDALSHTLGRLDRAGRNRLAAEAPRLATVAAGSTPEDFEKTLARETSSWVDREARLRHQRRCTGLKHWIDKDSGMIRLNGQFDPE